MLGCGSILREVIAAAQVLAADYDVGYDIWSVTSFTQLRRDGMTKARWNTLNPQQQPKIPYVTSCLADKTGPVIAATDYIHLYAEQLRAYITQPYVVLGTDGFGRSDTRKQLRHFFEVDYRFIVINALQALVQQQAIDAECVAKAIQSFGIDPNKADPMTI